MLMAATALLIGTHRRRSPSTPWLYYCPVALLMLSLVQFQSTLWGFQLCWYLVLLCFGAAVFLLDRPDLGLVAMSVAVLFGIIGSFSSSEGLMIWPAGLLLLFMRRRSARLLWIWIAVACVTVAAYFYRFNFNEAAPNHGYVLHHPLGAIEFLIFAIGDVVGISVKPGSGSASVLIFGSIVLLVALAVLAIYAPRRSTNGGAPVGVTVIAFGLLFVLTITVGRSTLGYWGASQSRYTTFDLLVLVGIYMTLLERPDRTPSQALPMSSDGAVLTESDLPMASASSTAPLVGRTLPILRWIAAVLVIGQVFLGLQNGIHGARETRQSQENAARVLQHLDGSSPAFVRYFVAPWLPTSYVYEQSRTAEELQLSLFSDHRRNTK